MAAPRMEIPPGQAPSENETQKKRRLAKSMRWAKASPLYTGSGIWSSRQVLSGPDDAQELEWDCQALSAYSAFPKLYGERKYSAPFPEQRFRFLDLPAEMRNAVYATLLDFGSIELSGESATSDYNTKPFKDHWHFIHTEVRPAVRFLRVCKQINREAIDFFYGLNEFRFSSRSGPDVLQFFCNTIGLANTRRLTKIAEHAPWNGHYNDGDRPAHAWAIAGVISFTNVAPWV